MQTKYDLEFLVGSSPISAHVHLTHTVHEGRKLWHVFSVTNGPPSAPEDGNVFTIAFDSDDCRWWMWE